MKQLAGQAGKTLGYLLHHTGMLIMTVFFVAAIGLGGLAYRLSLGPVEIPWITSQLASAVSGQGINISIARAALAWEGYRRGGGVPLFLQLGDIVARNSAGVELAEIPTARLVFLPGALIGTKAPILVTSSDALFAGSNVTVSLVAAIRLGFLHLAQAELNFKLGAGRLGAGDMSLPISGGAFTVTVTPNSVALRNGEIALGAVDGESPRVGFSGDAIMRQNWQGSLHVTADTMAADALAHYWPAGLAMQTRAWVTGNISAGTASHADFTFGISAPASLTGLSLNTGSGHFNGENLSVGWIPKAAPITGVTGMFTLNDLDTINITASAGSLGGVALTAAHLTITGVSHHVQMADLSVPISGNLSAALAVLNAPPLNLLKTAPLPLLQATGAMTGAVKAQFPLNNHLRLAQVDLHVMAHLSGGAAPAPVKGLDFSDVTADVTVSTSNLQASGNGTLDGQAASFTAAAMFGAGAPVIQSRVQTKAGKTLLALFGLAGDAAGQVPLDVQIKQASSGKTVAVAVADLKPAAIDLALLGWSKKAGEPGQAELAAAIAADGTFQLTEISAAAPGLEIAARAAAGGVTDLRFSRLKIGGTDATGDVRAPAAAGQPWRVSFAGQALDLSGLLNQAETGSKQAAPKSKPAPAGPSGPLWRANLRFGTLDLAKNPAPALHDLRFDGDGQGGSLFNARASAAGDEGQTLVFTASRSPGPMPREDLQAETSDGGYLLRAMGLYDDLENGAVTLVAGYAPRGDVSGVLTVTDFRLLHAPMIGKILQGMTLYGFADATSGPGLVFDRLVAPFSLGDDELTLTSARAFSSSLGFTASGTIGFRDGTADLDTTIVPAYFLNAAPGRIPVVGKLFSAETGGGLFAMRAKIQGKLSDPAVTVNPLSALTPGVLRDVFGIGGGSAGSAANAKP